MNRRFDGLGAAGSVGVLLALIALWWAASHGGWLSRVFLPSPEATLDSLLAGLGAGGELLAFTGATVGLALARELAPVFTSIVVAARAGAGMATELGALPERDRRDDDGGEGASATGAHGHTVPASVPLERLCSR